MAQTNNENDLDYSEIATEKLIKLHERGDIEATFTLGFYHFFNKDLSEKENVFDAPTGLAYLQEAHDKGHMQAHASLSTIYGFGLFGLPENIDKANIYNLEGAQRGSHVGKLNYGVFNLHNPKKDISQRAHNYLIEISAEDNVGGIANQYLAELYYFGNDHYKANYESARLFAENCVTFGQSNGSCEFILARDYKNGWGGPVNNEKSSQLFLQSAKAGNARAMWHTGMNALNGDGLEKNETTAFKWVSKAADADDQQAMISLAVMYALGQGTSIDNKKSYASYTRAAKLGSAHAIRGMAGMHCDGQGQDVDKEICKAGLFLAMEHGDDQAPLLLKQTFNITKDDIANIKQSRPSEESFWTNQFPWLLE